MKNYVILKTTSLVGTERLGASIGGGVGSGLGLDLGRTDGSFWFWWQIGEVLRGVGDELDGAVVVVGESGVAAFGDTAGDADFLGEVSLSDLDLSSSSVSLLDGAAVEVSPPLSMDSCRFLISAATMLVSTDLFSSMSDCSIFRRSAAFFAKRSSCFGECSGSRSFGLWSFASSWLVESSSTTTFSESTVFSSGSEETAEVLKLSLSSEASSSVFAGSVGSVMITWGGSGFCGVVVSQVYTSQQNLSQVLHRTLQRSAKKSPF